MRAFWEQPVKVLVLNQREYHMNRTYTTSQLNLPLPLENVEITAEINYPIE